MIRWLSGLVALLIFATGADAALPYNDPATGKGVLDQVLAVMELQMTTWNAPIRSFATYLFWTLGTISLTIRGAKLIVQKADISDFFAEFIRFILYFGFFLWLLRNGTWIASTIIDTMMTLGERTSGIPGLSPSGVVDVGFNIFKLTIKAMTWHPLDNLAVLTLGVAILLMLTAVGLNMLKLLAAAYFWMYAGFFYTGFGGSDWTSDMAIEYFKKVLNVGVQLFIITLVIGIGTTTLDLYYVKLTETKLTYEDLGVMLVFCYVLLSLSMYLPPLIAGIITHNAAAGLGETKPSDVARTASNVASTAAGVAVGAAGGASAIIAAVKEARANTAAGSAVSRMGGATGSESNGSGWSVAEQMGIRSPGVAPVSGAGGTQAPGGQSAKTGSGSNANGNTGHGSGQRVGNPGGQKSKAVGWFTPYGAAANLAVGAWDAAVSGTTGGRIAAAINARGAAERQGQADEATTFAGDSLAAANETDVNRDAEISAFVNRK